MPEQTQQEKDIAVVFQGTATKASGSTLGFEVGRERGTEALFLRIVRNDGGGTFTKAWQSIAALRGALSPYNAEGKGLRFADALGPAIPQKGRNNAPFVGYVLAAIGMLAANPEKPGEYTVAGDWEVWSQQMLALPVPPPAPPVAGTLEPATSAPGAEGAAAGKGKRTPKKGTAPAVAGDSKATVLAVGQNPAP